jgi:hypothetical protein
LDSFSADNNKVIELSKISLSNSGDGIFLFNNNLELVSNFSYSSTKVNKSFQFCSNNWLENNPTPGQQNNCTIATTPNIPQNNTKTPVQNNNSNQEASISLNINWDDDEIINGDEFKIEVDAKNLKNKKYNVKVWIKDEDGNIISDRYGEDSSGKKVWISGTYLIYNLFEGPGDETEVIKLRIRKNYKDFSGDAKIYFKIEGVDEDYESIEILKKEDKKQEIEKNNSEETKTTIKSNSFISEEVIKLGSSESKEITEKNTEKNDLIYESKNEKIKLYAFFCLAGLCIILCVLIVFKNFFGNF